MKNYRIGLLILFIAVGTPAFAQKATKEAMLGTWKYVSVDETKFSKKIAMNKITSADKAEAEKFKSLFLNSTIVFNADNSVAVNSPTRVEKGRYSLGYGNAMKYEINGVVVLFYVEEVTSDKLVIYIENSSILFTFKK